MFKAYDKKVEVNGETVLSVLDGMGMLKSKGLKILQRDHQIHGQEIRSESNKRKRRAR